MILSLIFACQFTSGSYDSHKDEDQDEDTGEVDTGTADTGEDDPDTGDSPDTGTFDSGDTGEVDTADTADTADTEDTEDTDEVDLSSCDHEPMAMEWSGEIEGDVRWCAADTHTLAGFVEVPAGLTLTIDPGVYVSAQAESWLQVEPGGRLLAAGTAASPITFESAGAGWYGIEINGEAPRAGGTGSDPASDSGVLQFLVILGASDPTGAEMVDALELAAVGSGTVVEDIWIEGVGADGLSIKGGSVNLSRIGIDHVGDDGLTWTEGYTGRIDQLWINVTGDRGIQGRSEETGLLPLSAPLVTNVTVVGAADTSIDLDTSSGGEIVNSVLVGAADCAFSADEASAGTGASLHHAIVWGAGATYCLAAEGISASVIEADPLLTDRVPAADSPALDPANADTTYADYVGAVGGSDWASWVP